MIFDNKIKTETSFLCASLVKHCTTDVKPNKIVEKFNSIFDIVEKIIQIQKPCSCVNTIESDRSININKLLKIYQDKGFVKKLTAIETSNSGWGLIATDKIEKYESIIEIPQDDMITELDAYRSPFGKSFLSKDPLLSKMSNLAMALFILNEKKNPQSKYRLYLDSLPRQLTTALYLTRNDIQLLKSTRALVDIVNLYSNFCGHYYYLVNEFCKSSSSTINGCFINKCFTIEEFRWAVSIIMSRNNFVPHNGRKILALIPIWDLMNHSNVETTTDFNDVKKSLVFYSTDSYNPSQEVFMQYGKLSTLSFYTFSGFIPMDNPNDTLRLRIGFNQSDCNFAKKKQILNKINCQIDVVPAFDINYLKFNGLSKELSNYLTIMLTNQNDMLEAMSNTTTPDLLELISAEFVKKYSDILSFIRNRCLLELTSLQRSLDSFNVKLLDNDLTKLSYQYVQHELKAYQLLTSHF